MKTCCGLILGLALAAIPALAQPADPYAYGLNRTGQLYLINLKTGSTWLIGDQPSYHWLAGLALTADGHLYSASIAENNRCLYELNPSSGVLTQLFYVGISLGGLAAGAGGLVAADFYGRCPTSMPDCTPSQRLPAVFGIDPITGSISSAVVGSSATGAVRALAVIDTNRALLSADADETNAARTLFEFALHDYEGVTAGTVTPLGALPEPAGNYQLTGIAFASDGSLYGVDNTFSFSGYGGRIWKINLANVAASTVIATGSIVWLGMAALPAGMVPAQVQLKDLIADVNELVATNDLSRGLGASLLAKLNAASTAASQGNCIAARNQVRAFINEVRALIQGGRLPSEVGQDLINAAQTVLDSLPC